MKKILLGHSGKISLTLDIWLSKHQKLSHVSLAAHFIDTNWVLRKKILSYLLIDVSHTGEQITEFINHILVSDSEISQKVISLSMDNAVQLHFQSNIKVLVPKLTSNEIYFTCVVTVTF